MAATRGRVDKQLIKSTTPRSLVYTDLSNEQTYFAPPTGADYVLQWDNGATDFAWLPTTSLINIYNNDGTLSANRTVTGEDKFLLFSFDDAVDSTSELSLNASSISAGVHNISTDTISSFQTLSDSVIFSAEDLSSGEQAFSSYTTTSITNALYGTTGVQSFTWDGVGGMVVQDSELSQGMKYAASYAAYFATNPRSIPDVGYVQTLIAASPSGTVTSVGLSLPSIFSVSGSPVTSSGTLTGTLATQAANTIFAGPVSGGAATPTFRTLTSSDIGAGIIGSTQLADTTVTPGTYTYATVTFDADGRATAASSGTAPVTGSGTVGQIPYLASSTTIATEVGSGSNALTWDFSNNRIGVATTAPQRTLHVGGDMRLAALVSGNLNSILGVNSSGDVTGLASSTVGNVPAWDGSKWVNSNTSVLALGPNQAKFGNSGQYPNSVLPSSSYYNTYNYGEAWFYKITNLSLTKSVGNYMPEVEISEFSDVLVAANARYGVTFSDGVSRSSIFQYNNSGNWTGTAAGAWDTVTIDLTSKGYYNSNGITYPDGWVYVVFYSTATSADVLVRMMDRNGIWYTSTIVESLNASNNSAYKYYRVRSPNGLANYVTKIEISLLNPPGTTFRVAGIRYLPTREYPFTLYARTDEEGQDLYGNYTWKNTSNVISHKIYAGGDAYLGVLGNVGIGLSTASSITQKLHVSGNMRLTGAYFDGLNSAGSTGNILTSTGGATQWATAASVVSAGGGVTGTGTTNTLPKWTSSTALGNSQITDNGTTVSIASQVAVSSSGLKVTNATGSPGNIEIESPNAVTSTHKLNFKSTYRVFNQIKSVSTDGFAGYLDILTTDNPASAGETGLITAMSIKRTGVQIPVGLYTENGATDPIGNKTPYGILSTNWAFLEIPKQVSNGQGVALIKFPYMNAGSNQSRTWIGADYNGNFGQSLIWWIGRTGNVVASETDSLRAYYGFESAAASGIPNHNFLGKVNINPSNYAVAGIPQFQVRGSGTTSSTYTAQFHNSTGSSNSLVIRDDGMIGLGTSSPTAHLHLKVGSATASMAPLKFTTASAALLTTPEAGAMEVLTTRIYYTDSTATRNTLAYLTDITSGVSITTDYIPVGTGTGITASTLFRDSATLLTSTDAVRTIGIYLNSMASLTDGIIANTGLTTSTSFQPFSATRAGSGNMVIRMDHAGTGNNYLYLKGNTTGDSYVQFNTGGANNYAVGTDASATHVFKIRYGADPSTGTTLFTANSSGNVGLRTDPHATQQIYLSGTLRVDLGSDATGDVYYRNSGGAFTRLAAGTNGHVLTLASGIPSWAAVSTGITSGTTKQIPYYSASNTLSSPSAAGVDALTWDFATAFFGVGTNAPASRLHVVNSNATTSYATFSGLLNTSASITSLDISRTAGSGSLDLVQTHSGTGNNCIVLQGNGTGDTFFTYGVSGPSVAYSHGVDASDSLIWKFGSGGTGSNPSTNTNLFWTANHTTNKIGLRTNPHATQDIYLLGTLRLDLGSDATGDIYYRNSGGAFTRLGIGSTDQVLKVASGIPSWSADLNGIYTGSGSLSTDTTVSMGTHFLFIEGSSATSHATFINLTPATDTIDIVARDLSIGSYIGEVYIDPTFVSIGLEHDTIPGGDASYINFQPTGSTWIWGNHEITLDGSGITVTDAVGSGFVYAADYSTSILTNNRSVPDIFTVRENNIENYTIVTSTTSPFNLSGLPPDFLINQGGTQATFTFSLPATPANGQICKLTFNNIVTTLTITAQGGITILGTAPTTAMVGTQLEYKYYSSISAWIRVK